MQARAGVCAFLEGSVLCVRRNFKKVQRTNYCVADKPYLTHKKVAQIKGRLYQTVLPPFFTHPLREWALTGTTLFKTLIPSRYNGRPRRSLISKAQLQDHVRRCLPYPFHQTGFLCAVYKRLLFSSLLLHIKLGLLYCVNRYLSTIFNHFLKHFLQ